MMKKFFGFFIASVFVFLLFSCAYAPPSYLPLGSETVLPSVSEKETQAPDTQNENKKNVHIMIDAGHGGRDPGAIASYDGVTYREKDINLSISLLLREELLLRGYTVFFTREDDRLLLDGRDNIAEIKARRELALELETDLYISLHCNSFDGEARAYGPIVFYREKANYRARKFADILKNAITEGMKEHPDTRECRMKRDDDYAVLKTDSMPTLLFEMGFLTDRSDAMQLIDTEWQSALVRAIADGIDDMYDNKYID